MLRSAVRGTGCILFLGAALAGCSEVSNPTAPGGGMTPQFAVGGGTPGVVDTGEFEVCKHGTAATFEYSINSGPVTSVTLAAGECAVLASTEILGAGTISVTTTETADPGIVLDSIVATINTIRNPTGVRGSPITGTTTYTSAFNGDRGVLVEFYNSVVPPPPPPPGGCTYTQGYWKNHSSAWPQSHSPNATFYGSGQSWLNVLKTAPKGGNVYYILGHQFIAATLNKANGAGVPAHIQSALDDATAYFLNPGGSTLSKGQLTALSSLLDSYNNGNEGFSHCP